MTGSVKSHLHNLARAALIGRYPILLQVPLLSSHPQPSCARTATEPCSLILSFLVLGLQQHLCAGLMQLCIDVSHD